MKAHTGIMDLRPCLRAFDCADITAPRRAGILQRVVRRMRCILVDRYARVDADILVAGADYWANYMMGALAIRAGWSVALYHHPDSTWDSGFDQCHHRRMRDTDPEIVQRLAQHLKVDIDAGFDTIEAVLGAFYSGVARARFEAAPIPRAVNIVGSHLKPDKGVSAGLPGGELFRPDRPLRHASVDSKQTVVAMRMPGLPGVRFARSGRSLVTANQCVLTSRIPGFEPRDMQCATFTLPSTGQAQVPDAMAQHEELDTMLAAAGLPARPAELGYDEVSEAPRHFRDHSPPRLQSSRDVSAERIPSSEG